MGERVLITGGAGFIGSHLAHRLVKEGYDVILLDNLTRGKFEYIRDIVSNYKARFVKGDIRDLEVLRPCMVGVKYVFHEAALCINYCFAYPEEGLDVNINGSYTVFKMAIESGVKRLIFASSASVYGTATHFPTNENDALVPLTPYCVTKVAAEYLLKISGLEYNILRYFNVYGTRQCTDAYYTNVIVKFIKKLLAGESPIIHANGQQTMDFINIHDIVEANLVAMQTETSNETFNVASGVSTSVNDLFKLLSELLHKRRITPIYQPFPANAGKMADRRQADNSKLSSLGWSNKVSLTKGLSDLIEDVKENPSNYG